MSSTSTTKAQNTSTITISDDPAGRTRPDVELSESEYKREIENLKKANQEIEHLFSSLSTIIIGLSPQHCINRINAFAENVFGLKAAEVIGQTLSSSCIPWDGGRVQGGLSSCRRQGGSIRVDDITFRRSNGKQGYLGITINPIRTDAGLFLGFIIIGADITERKALESNLVQTEKLKSIGQLAAGIAHEINTPTQYVGDNTRFLQDAFDDLLRILVQYARLLQATKAGTLTEVLISELEENIAEADLDYLIEEIPTAIQHTLEGVDRIAKIVRAMKEFSHPGQEEKTAVDINKAIESTITVARNEWKYVADMVTDFDPALPTVPCFPGELNQVILNMLINAAHAVGDVVGQHPMEKGGIKVITRKKENWAEIQISDTGSGIPVEIRSRIFDPFFTTKEVGKGTGQGLAISHAVIVEKHGGSIDLDTEEGRGTTFTIRLPLKDQGDG
jgi:PAS domain S-box-containing protein